MRYEDVKTLVNFPYVVVRINCRFCARKRRFRLARLAARCGPDMGIEEVLDLLACAHGRPKGKLRKYQHFCGVQYQDLTAFDPPPPDMPPDRPEGLHMVVNNTLDDLGEPIRKVGT